MIIAISKSIFSSGSIQRIGYRSVSSVVPTIKSSMSAGCIKNEPILTYMKGSEERKKLEAELCVLQKNCTDIPIVIGGKEYRPGQKRYQVMPHNKRHKLASFYYADKELIEKAIEAASCAQKIWDEVPFDERIAIWNRAADLMATKYRYELNAATMLGQAKSIFQAEIDSACELIDFIRLNAYYLNEHLQYQLISENPKVTLNSTRFRGIDGFFAAISPFNFSAIGGNLAYTPALMGNGVLWKPSDTAVLSNWTIFKIMREAGVPDGVVNFVPADGPVFGSVITRSKYLAGINFTGSVPTFNWLWREVGANVDTYMNYPRMIGECGGKNYHLAHSSADACTVAAQTIRSAFEFSGQKCSACSRFYCPESLWPKVKEQMLKIHSSLLVDAPTNYKTFMSAVIDQKAFDRIKGYVELARSDKDLTILAGGTYDDSDGFFIQPTIVQTSNPTNKIMQEEIFGPVLTCYVYPDNKVNDIMELIGNTTPFALTGAIFAQDQEFLKCAFKTLKMTAGNFYVNDKSTGAVVGQQPFGGARKSGTNDKAGGPHYVLRFTTPQSVKETFVPLHDVTYPYMQE